MTNFSCINFFVLLNTICCSLFVGYAKGTFPTIPPVDKNPLEGLPLVGPALPLNMDVAPPPTVPPCCGCENSFQGFINSITNSKLFGSSGNELKISACDNSDLFQLFGTCLEDREECDSSNYPYVVFLLTRNKNGEMKTTCQGVLLCDGSILTVYQCTQIGEGGLWVRFPCGALVKVKCMKQPKQCSSDLVESVYTIKLILESSSCDCENHVYRPPVITKECSSQSPFIEGYLVVQANVSKCSSEVYAISLKPALLLFDPTNVGFSLVLVAKPEDLCSSYQGALFIGKNGEVYGMAIYKVRVVNNVKNVSPYTKGLLSTLRCIIPIIKMDLLDDCNC